MDSTCFYGTCAVAIGFFTLLGTISFTIYRKYRFHQNNKIVSSSLSLPSLPSSLSRNWRHQVFPSFRGEDVRKGFLSHILKEFERKGITPFIDNDIDRSKSIGPELIEAIRRSRIAIVLISTNYASSTWCLNELVEIMKCRKELDQIVMIIFYEVDPTDVKKQTGDFGTIFEKTCVGKKVETVKRWREALEEVAKIAGYDSSSWKNEADMIERIANDVSNMLNNATPSSDFDGLVGMEAHVTQISSLLSLDSNEVMMVGIWGPAGIGKTTIARALYRKLSNNFTHTAFMESTRGSGEERYSDDIAFMLHLQEQLMSKIFNHKNLTINHLGVAEERLKDKKVLIVLDDVDDLKQLKAMAYETRWFGCGSRIIITTKDKKLLKAHGINHIYHVDFPRSSDAFEILCLSAFGQKSPYNGFEELTMEVRGLAGNLPLGLTVFGSYLRGMSKDEWIDALPSLRTSLDGNIEKVLRFSYEALCDKHKDLFLHIACLFKDETTSNLVDYLAESDLDVKHGLQVLAEKSLISINKVARVVMHNLLEQLGKEIVRKEHRDEPERRKFLVDAREICDVLAENTGSRTILGIYLNIAATNDEFSIDERAFERMSRLQFLRFDNPYDLSRDKLVLPRGLNNLPRKLRVLHWHKFPMRCLPPKFRGEFLVNLEMRNSLLEKLWEGTPAPLRCLKRMDLSHSYNLKEVPNLSTATNLEALILTCCKNLEEIPSSIGNLDRLVELRMAGCPMPKDLSAKINLLKSLSQVQEFECQGLIIGRYSYTNNLKMFVCDTAIKVLPASIKFLSHLQSVSMSKCYSLKVFPDVPDSIEELNLSETGIEEVPTWIQNLSRLTDLWMVGCRKLKILPTDINLESLSSLDLSHCTRLKTFPEISTSIENLDLENTGIQEVPSSISCWLDFVKLNMRGCKSLKVFPNVPDSMEELDLSHTGITLLGGELEAIPDWTEEEEEDRSLHLDLNGCKNLVSLPQLPDSLIYLDASNCDSLETIDGFFDNPGINLHFANCLKLNEEARELIQRSPSMLAVLPCGEVPSYFSHQGIGSSLTIPLINHREIPKFLWFKACVLLTPFSGTPRTFGVSWSIRDVHNAVLVGHGLSFFTKEKLVTDHLFTFEDSFSLEKDKDHEVVSSLLLVFQIVSEQRMKDHWEWETVESDSLKLRIVGCGVRIFDVHGEDECSESSYQVEEGKPRVKKAKNEEVSGDLSAPNFCLSYDNNFRPNIPRLPRITMGYYQDTAE